MHIYIYIHAPVWAFLFTDVHIHMWMHAEHPWTLCIHVYLDVSAVKANVIVCISVDSGQRLILMMLSLGVFHCPFASSMVRCACTLAKKERRIFDMSGKRGLHIPKSLSMR